MIVKDMKHQYDQENPNSKEKRNTIKKVWRASMGSANEENHERELRSNKCSVSHIYRPGEKKRRQHKKAEGHSRSGRGQELNILGKRRQ